MWRLANDKALQERAAAFGERIQAENGLEMAVGAFYKYLANYRPRCSP
jgi:hypothetical protein